MKPACLILFLLSLFQPGLSQQPSDDEINTLKGSLKIRPVFHAALVLTWNGITIYSDPYGGAKAFEGLPEPDLILITDIHSDHFNTETLNSINTAKADLIVPQAVFDELPEELKKKASVLANNNTTKSHGIQITAIPMYNLPEEPESRHTRGRGNGYVLGLGETQVYISGDTEDIPEMRQLKNIDVAFVCMNLPFTMDVNQAAAAVLDFKPKIVYPFHYRGKDGLSDVEAFRKIINSKDPSIDVRLRNWYSR